MQSLKDGTSYNGSVGCFLFILFCKMNGARQSTQFSVFGLPRSMYSKTDGGLSPNKKAFVLVANCFFLS